MLEEMKGLAGLVVQAIETVQAFLVVKVELNLGREVEAFLGDVVGRLDDSGEYARGVQDEIVDHSGCLFLVTERGCGEEMEADARVEDEREDVERPVPFVELADFRELRPASVGLHLGDEPAEVFPTDGVVHPVVADDRPGGVEGEDRHEVGRLEVTVLVVAFKEMVVDDGLEDVLVSLIQPSCPELDILDEGPNFVSKGRGNAHCAAEGDNNMCKPSADGLLAKLLRPEGVFVGGKETPERVEDLPNLLSCLCIVAFQKGPGGEKCELFVDGRHIFLWFECFCMRLPVEIGEVSAGIVVAENEFDKK